MKEGNVLSNKTLNTFSLRLCGVGYMATQIARGNPLPPLHGLIFSSRSGQVRVFNVHIQSKLL